MSSELDELRELLERLQTQSPPFSASTLYGLSDLSGERLAEFQKAWPTYDVAQRRHLLQSLVELTELSFEVSFDAIFQYCLVDPDEEVRASAIDGLWESEDINLIGPLLTMLRSDPSVGVRAAAASALGRFVLAGELEQLDQRIQDRIMTELLTTIHLSGESVAVRRRALESAAYACSPDVLDALELSYYDEDENLRLSAVVGMGRSCDKRWRDIIIQELENASPAMRYEAAWACGELSLQQAVPTLARLISDPDRQVCNASIWALGQIGGPEAKQALLTAYDDADEDTQAALDDALAEQALLDGDLDFLLYELGIEDNGWLDDESDDLWDDDEDQDDEFERDDWDSDDS